jgi:hypothetical protein
MRARFKSSDDAPADAAPPSDDAAAPAAAPAADAADAEASASSFESAPRFKHAFLIFNPAAGQENPVRGALV